MIDTRQILEEFQLKTVLATSPTGAIFLAEDPDSRRDVVIKLVSCAVPNAEDQIRELFLSMAVAAQTSDIPAMPKITDHGLTPEGDGFLVMEHLGGLALGEVDEVSPFAALNIIIDVLSCVEGLARAGTAHLNLKTDNVMVTNQPANDRAVVVGFGTSATLLHAGAGIPVPAEDPHLAPELVAGDVLPGHQAWRSDLFSLGVIACGVLGAEIEADGYERPRIRLSPVVRSTLGEVEPLEAMLGQIMDPDPMRRGDSPSDVRDPLIRAFPDLPPVAANTGEATDKTPEAAVDPNKTDPSFDPAATVMSLGAPDVSAVAATGESSPAETVLTATPKSGAPADPNPAVAGSVEEHGWPEILFDDPGLPDSLDDTEDTDIRNPIPEDVWVPKAGEGEAADSVPVAVRPSSGKGGAGGRLPVLKVALVTATVVILGGIIAITWFSGDEEADVPVTSSIQVEEDLPREPLVPPPEDDNQFDDLLAVQRLVDAGDLEGAREALSLIDQREGISFSSDEDALYNSLVSAVTRAADRGSAIEDLRGGLRHGSIKMLRRGVAGVSLLAKEEIDEVDGLADDLDRGSTAVRLHGAMWQAHRDGDHLGAIRHAGRLERVLPEYTGSDDIRGQAAAELEARAEGYIATHEYPNAAAVLDSLLRVWPDRDGATERLAWCREQIEETQQAEASISTALARGDQGDPEAGLAMLGEVIPEPQLLTEIDAARTRLEAQLAELDAAPPVIEIFTSQPLAFKKNQAFSVPLRVTDDYRVEKVIVHAKNESDDGYLQIPLPPIGEGLYNFIITPDLHGNQDVSFFVVAKDRSGNVGRLGSQEAPRKVERKRWFKKISK